MPDLSLTFAMKPYDRVMPLITGEVKPAGITLEYQGMPGAAPQVFYDQIKHQRYDLSEFSLSSFMVERAHGWPYQLLPVFHNRNFSYTGIAIRMASGIRQGHPEDLKGKRFAVTDYQQTAALWIRGILKHEFGVEDADMEWVQTRGANLSHMGASGSKPPAGVKLSYADADFGRLFLRGAIDASMSYSAPEGSGIDRATVDVSDNPDFPLLFPDPRAEGVRFFQKTGIFPPHHTTAIRESILKAHPWVAMSLMDAFEKAKTLAMKRIREIPPTLLVFGPQYLREVRGLMGDDPFAYGIRANIRAIEFIQQISVEQGLTKEKQPLNQIFPEEVFIAEERL